MDKSYPEYVLIRTKKFRRMFLVRTILEMVRDAALRLSQEPRQAAHTRTQAWECSVQPSNIIAAKPLPCM